jgi:hypothetical protein
MTGHSALPIIQEERTAGVSPNPVPALQELPAGKRKQESPHSPANHQETSHLKEAKETGRIPVTVTGHVRHVKAAAVFPGMKERAGVKDHLAEADAAGAGKMVKVHRVLSVKAGEETLQAAIQGVGEKSTGLFQDRPVAAGIRAPKEVSAVGSAEAGAVVEQGTEVNLLAVTIAEVKVRAVMKEEGSRHGTVQKDHPIENHDITIETKKIANHSGAGRMQTAEMSTIAGQTVRHTVKGMKAGKGLKRGVLVLTGQEDQPGMRAEVEVRGRAGEKDRKDGIHQKEILQGPTHFQGDPGMMRKGLKEE